MDRQILRQERSGHISYCDSQCQNLTRHYTTTITDSLCLKENSEVTISTEGVSGPVERVTSKYSKHPSITKTRSSVKKMMNFLNSKPYPWNR